MSDIEYQPIIGKLFKKMEGDDVYFIRQGDRIAMTVTKSLGEDFADDLCRQLNRAITYGANLASSEESPSTDFKTLFTGFANFYREGFTCLFDSIFENSGIERGNEILANFGREMVQVQDVLPYLTSKELEQGFEKYIASNPIKEEAQP